MTTHAVFEAEEKLNGQPRTISAPLPRQYGVLYRDITVNLDYVLYITADSEEDAINIPVFRTGNWTPLSVFRMPSGPGPGAAERIKAVGTQQWVVE